MFKESIGLNLIGSDLDLIINFNDPRLGSASNLIVDRRV